MMRIFGYIGVLVTLLIGAYLVTIELKSSAPEAAHGPASPRAAADLTGVRMDLSRFSQIEKQHMASDGHYVSLDEIEEHDTGAPQRSRGPYAYSIDYSDSTFTITAAYSGPAVENLPPVISLDQTGEGR